MIAHIPRIDERGFKGAPPALIHALQFRRVDSVVQQTAFAADQMDVEVVGLEAVHAGSYLRDFVSTLKLENRDAGCIVFIRDEILPLRLRAGNS